MTTAFCSSGSVEFSSSHKRHATKKLAVRSGEEFQTTAVCLLVKGVSQTLARLGRSKKREFAQLPGQIRTFDFSQDAALVWEYRLHDIDLRLCMCSEQGETCTHTALRRPSHRQGMAQACRQLSILCMTCVAVSLSHCHVLVATMLGAAMPLHWPVPLSLTQAGSIKACLNHERGW